MEVLDAHTIVIGMALPNAQLVPAAEARATPQ